MSVDQIVAAAHDPVLHSNALADMLRTAADESRQDLAKRNRLGKEGILRALTGLLLRSSCEEDRIEVDRQCLRCIGNACALNPEAVQRLCDIGVTWLQKYLTSDDRTETIQGLAISVIYNMLATDFTLNGEEPNATNPASQACYEAGAHLRLIDLIADNAELSLSTEDLVDMLFWLSPCATDQSQALPDTTIEKILHALLPQIHNWPTEMMTTAVEAIIALLRPQNTRAALASRFKIDPLMNMLQTLEDRIALAKTPGEAEAEDLVLLSPQSSNLTWLLSDVSAEPSFAKNNEATTKFVVERISALSQSAGLPDQIFIASCLIVGNALLNMDESQTTAIIQSGCVDNIVARLRTASATPDMLYAGAGLLTNLCRPKESRGALGSVPGLPSLIETLCVSATPQISQAGLRLVRGLGRDCPANQALLAPILEGMPKPENTAG